MELLNKKQANGCVFLTEKNECAKDPDWANQYEGFAIAVYVVLVLMICKELSKFGCILWLLAARQGKVPRRLRR